MKHKQQQTLEDMRQRERSRVLWTRIYWGSLCVTWLCGIYTVGLAVIGAFFIIFSQDASLPAVTVMVSVFLGWVTTAAFILLNKAGPKFRKKVDLRLDPHAYKFLIKHLRGIGVTDPVAYLAHEHPSVASFQRVYNNTRVIVEPPATYKGQRKDRMRRKLHGVLDLEALRIASLVLPDNSELEREDQIMRLIHERGCKTYAAVKEMLNAADEHSTPLNDGIL